MRKRRSVVLQVEISSRVIGVEYTENYNSIRDELILI